MTSPTPTIAPKADTNLAHHARPPTTSSSSSRPQKNFFGYPEPRLTTVPYKSPPENKNPIFRGLLLAIGVKIVANVGPIAGFLYNNAGFNSLRGLKEVDDLEARYEPVVIPIKTAEDERAVNYAREEALRLLRDREGEARFWSVRDYHEGYKSGRVTPTDVATALLPLIRRDVQGRTKHATAFLDSRVELVMAAAEASTLRWREGRQLGVLDGVPIAVKDEIDVKGYKRSFGTRKVYVNGDMDTAWCIAKWEELGAVIVGKTNMHEIGMDTTNNNPVTGTPLNPYNDKYYTGGSSGGSGYAVGAGLVPFALGCDGGGSIRIPSSYCGIYGLKTSHGRVSERPTPCLAGTNTVIGPMASDMTSLEIAYRVMATPDPHHTHSSLFPPPRRLSTPTPKRIGIYKNWFDRADEPVKTLCQTAIDHYVNVLGYEVIDIHIPLIHEGQTAHALSILSEAVNGVPEPRSFLSPATRVLLSVGSRAPASDYIQANRVRNLLMQHLAALFTQYPGLLIVNPTTPTVGWEIKKGAKDLAYGVSDGDMSIRSMEYIWLANFSGCPAITAPVGYATPKKGFGTEEVPIGLMAMAEWGAEDQLVEWGFEAEAFLGREGRRRPVVWVDVLKEADRVGASGVVVGEKEKEVGE